MMTLEMRIVARAGRLLRGLVEHFARPAGQPVPYDPFTAAVLNQRAEEALRER